MPAIDNHFTIRPKTNRDLRQQCLKENSIASAIYYPLCLHLQQVYKELGHKKEDFPVAERVQEEVLSLPIYLELEQKQVERITQIILENN